MREGTFGTMRMRGEREKWFFFSLSMAPRKEEKKTTHDLINSTCLLSLSTLSQPDPVTPTAPLYAPYYGATAPLFATTQRFGIDPVSSFAPLGSAVQIGQYAEVATLGIASFLNQTSPVNGVSYPRASRNPTQNITGTYWGYDGQKELGTPPRLYNQFIRKVVETRGNTESQKARLFAFVNAGMADVGTLVWSTKYSQFYQR